MIPIKDTTAGVAFAVQVLPRSSLCKVAGAQGDYLRIKITAPPVDGRANEEVIRFLAGIFGVRKDQVQIMGGLKAKKKTILIKGITKEDAERALTAALSVC
ncbi:MAG: DUF167 domain-containing protein [Syntrophales bacterium]